MTLPDRTRQRRRYVRLHYATAQSSVVALVHDPLKQDRLANALRSHYRITLCHEAARLLEEAAIHDPIAVIAESRDARGLPTGPPLRALRRRNPWLPILLYCRSTPEEFRAALAIAEDGATTTVLVGFDDNAVDFRTALARAERHTTVTYILTELAKLVPQSVLPIITYCLQNGHRDIPVQSLANALGVSRQAVDKSLRNAGLPSARTIIGWSRLLHAARLMEHPELPTDRIANILEFPSGSALRNLLMRFTGLTPTQVRGGGGGERVLDGFKKSLRIRPFSERKLS